jgi:uncharacterized protein YecE (DUF72 family)
MNVRNRTTIGRDNIRSAVHQSAIRIGTAGWNIPREAASNFAAEGTHLERYSQLFNCCEINSCFYRAHKQSTWERWADSVPAGFKFSVKAPRIITHEAALDCDLELLSPFLEQTNFLGEKLGPVLIQLPPSLQFEDALIRRFFSLLRERFSGGVACEPRHSSWFSSEVDELMKDYEVARVAADPACVPTAALPGGFAGLVYFRLHGSPHRYYSAYPGEFINAIADQLHGLHSRAEAWCVFDNTASGAAIENALDLKAKVMAR